MARKKKTSVDKPPLPQRHNNALATDIDDMYSLVLGGMNRSEPQSESNSTLKLLSQLQQESRVEEEEEEEEEGSFYTGYNPYKEIERRGPLYYDGEQSSRYWEYDRYKDEIPPLVKEHRQDGEDIMQALSALAKSNNMQAPLDHHGSIVQAIEGPGQQQQQLALPAPTESHLLNGNLNTRSTEPNRINDTSPGVNLAQNIESVLANLSNLGAINNTGLQAAATTIETTGNGSAGESLDVQMVSSSNSALKDPVLKLLENKDGKLVEASFSMNRDEPLRISKVVELEKTAGSFTQADGHQKYPEDGALLCLSNLASHSLSLQSNHTHNGVSLETQTLAPNGDTQHENYVREWAGSGAVNKPANKPASSIDPEFTKPVDHFTPQHKATNSNGADISPSKASQYGELKSSKAPAQGYLRFGRQDLSRGESWIPNKSSVATAKADSYTTNYSQRPHLSHTQDNNGTDTYRPRTWVREGFEPPSKKHKFEPANTKYDSYRPSYSGERKHSGSYGSGSQKPQHYSNKFSNSAASGREADFKVFGKPKFEMIPYTKEQVEKFLNESLSHPNLKIAYFVQKSQELVHNAHESLVVDKSLQSVLNYHKFIKAAIKCLLILVKKYTKELNPHLLVSIYYKIARLYLDETESFDLAEAYATRAQTICRDHSLVEFQFFCDLLVIEIYEKIDITMVVGFAQRRVAYYEEGGFHLLATCLQLARMKYLLISDVTFALVNLQRFVKDPKLHPTVKEIALVYLAGLHNFRGDHAAAVELLRGYEVKAAQQPFEAYVLMTKLLANVSLNNTPESKFVIKELMRILNEGEKSNWEQWQINGDIKFHIKGELNIEFDFVVSWLPVVDFKTMLYFLSGIAYLHAIGDRSKVCFEKAYSSIGHAQDDLKLNRNLAKYFTANEVQQRYLKLQYIRYLVQFYQQWQLFVNDDMRMVFLNDFMTANNKFFTRDEYTMFKPMYPYINYMFALYYHSRGDIQAAKFYYLKVRNMTSSLLENDASTSLQQMNNGLGGDTVRPHGNFSELNVYSTFHLIILLDYEVNEIMLKKDTAESQLAVEKFTAIRNTLFDEFSTVNKQPPKHADSFQYNFVIYDKLLCMTLEIIMTLLRDIPPDLEIKDLRLMLVKIGDKTTFYFISFILTYFLVIKTSGTNDKMRFVTKCLDVLPKSRCEMVQGPLGNKEQVSISESADSCRVLLLRELMEINKNIGFHKHVDMEKLQLERLYKLLALRYGTLEENVTYDPTFKILSKVKSENEDVEMKNA